MHIPVVSAWLQRRRERRRTRELRAATVAQDLTRAQVAAALNDRVLPETLAAAATRQRKTDTIMRAAVATVHAASGSFPPRPKNGAANGHAGPPAPREWPSEY